MRTFIVHVKDGTYLQILARNAIEAWKTAELQGYVVLSVDEAPCP